MYWAGSEPRTRSWPIPGTGDGRAYVHDGRTAVGSLSLYSAEAHAWRGDIEVDVFVLDTKPIAKKEIMDLAARQMGRL